MWLHRAHTISKRIFLYTQVFILVQISLTVILWWLFRNDHNDIWKRRETKPKRDVHRTTATSAAGLREREHWPSMAILNNDLLDATLPMIFVCSGMSLKVQWHTTANKYHNTVRSIMSVCTYSIADFNQDGQITIEDCFPPPGMLGVHYFSNHKDTN